MAAWFDHGERGMARQPTTGAPSWTNEAGVTIGVHGEREVAGAPEEGAPPGTRAWLSLVYQGQPAPCPPCPPDFEGTLMPGCNCP